ncbi:MAG: AAA family ATPase [Chloroflexi bacterium]|nr:AAA family ATPase [Chloroflexota bacterium]
MTAKIITIANQKGGVGKTTTVINLGHGLAQMGKNVLIVDLDPQGQCATSLGMKPEEGAYYLLTMGMKPQETQFISGIQKSFCPRLGNRAQIYLQFIAGHANARITNGDDFFIFIDTQADC